jgi:hypothetical protein
MAWLKTVSVRDSIKAFIVEVDGVVSVDASVTKFRDAILKFTATRESEDGLVQECLAGVFATYPGAKLNVPAITSMTIQAMGKRNPDMTNPALYGMLTKRVGEVLKSLTGDAPELPYAAERGPRGGHYAKADQVVAPVSAV